MPELKLAKLPDRVPVKLTITVQPDLAQALREYAAVYRATYGEAESVEELVPFMLASFLEGDRGFVPRPDSRRVGLDRSSVMMWPRQRSSEPWSGPRIAGFGENGVR